MEAASQSTSHYTTSPTPMTTTTTTTTTATMTTKSYVSSAHIELRPNSAKAKSKTRDVSQHIELTTLRNEDSETKVIMRKKASSGTAWEPSSAGKAGVNSVPSRMATTSMSENDTSTPSYPMLTSSRTKKDRKRWNAVEEADSRKGLRATLKRMMGCGSSLDAMYDDPMPVVVFGATGLVGGAVARVLLRDRRFEVKAVTRTPTTDVARKLAEEGAIIVTADLNDPRSLTRVLEGAHAVFLITHFWEHMNKDKEITQGKNCVDAAMSTSVGHFVFYGSESPSDVTGGQCGYLESKANIEKYIKTTSLPYTIIRVPFYFENFLGVFKPHRVRNGVFAVALPMEDKALEVIAVQDVGRGVLRVLLKPKLFLCRVVPLGSERLTLPQIIDVLNKHFTDRKFISPKIRVKDYESFNFDGSKDIAAMFEFYQHGGQEARDPKLARKLQGPPTVCFDRWVAENKHRLAESMDAT